MSQDYIERAMKVWGAHPRPYDGATHVARLMWLRRSCLPCPPCNILDLGCAGGYGITVCAGDVGETLGFGGIEETTHAGVDVNEEFIKGARESHPGCQFEVFDLMDIAKEGKKLPFEDKSFDIVIATEVMEHLDVQYWPFVLKEVKRVGRFQFLSTVPNGGMPDREYDYFPAVENPPAAELYVGHQYEPCFSRWSEIMDTAFGISAHCTKILGFFTANCWIKYPFEEG